MSAGQYRAMFNFGSGDKGQAREALYRRAAKKIKGEEKYWQEWLREIGDKEAEKVLKNLDRKS